MGARKPRVGWRNRNYLAGLSEATEEKGLVARVSCGRRLKYRKFKHRSLPSPFVPRHHRHWIYISSTASSASPLFPSRSLALPSLLSRKQPARDPPRFSASGRRASLSIYIFIHTHTPASLLATISPLRRVRSPLFVDRRITAVFLHWIDRKRSTGERSMDGWMDGSFPFFFLLFQIGRIGYWREGEGERDRYSERHSTTGRSNHESKR